MEMSISAVVGASVLYAGCDKRRVSKNVTIKMVFSFEMLIFFGSVFYGIKRSAPFTRCSGVENQFFPQWFILLYSQSYAASFSEKHITNGHHY